MNIPDDWSVGNRTCEVCGKIYHITDGECCRLPCSRDGCENSSDDFSDLCYDHWLEGQHTCDACEDVQEYSLVLTYPMENNEHCSKYCISCALNHAEEQLDEYVNDITSSTGLIMDALWVIRQIARRWKGGDAAKNRPVQNEVCKANRFPDTIAGRF